MRTLTRKERLTGQIGVSLLAGMFSMVPVAFGMPVVAGNLDANHRTVAVPVPVAGTNLTVTPTAGVEIKNTSATEMGINGSAQRNVIAWEDFSVANGEIVQFDGGNPTNDYLNIVTQQATSFIDGTVKGGNNVYLVNPNGVIFAEGAQVNVGSLYVSTQKPDTVDVSGFQNGSSTSSPLGASPMGDADVVNLGTIKANQLTIVGNNVSLQDSAKIYKSNSNTVNTDVTIQAAGYIHVGHDDAVGTWTDFSTKQDSRTAAYKDLPGNPLNNVVNYQLVDDVTDLGNMTTGGNYMLAKNVSGGTLSHQHIKKDAPFTGNFDGMYHEIQNVTMTGGLFPAAKNATIENVGVVGGTVKAANYTVGFNQTGTGAVQEDNAVFAAGAIVGYATESTKLHNVYSEEVSMSDTTAINGGLVGIAGEGTLEISESYNTSLVLGTGNFNNFSQTGTNNKNYGGGIVGYVVGVNTGNREATVHLTDVYNDGDTNYGMIGGMRNAVVTINDSYSTQKASQDALAPTSTPIATITDNGLYTDSKELKDYAALSSISNKGGENKTWRIYEGQTTPLLTAFFKGTATVDVNKNNVKSDTQVYNGTSRSYVTSKTPASTMTYANGNVSKVYDGREINTNIAQSDLSGNAQSDFGTNVMVAQSREGNNATGVDKNVGDHALVYSLQHGYDIVGGNAEITKRSLEIKQNMFFSKTYDGRSDIMGTAKDLFTAAAGETGLVDGDDVNLPGNVTGKFYESASNQTLTVDAGADRYVELEFTPDANNNTFDGTLGGSSAGNYMFECDPQIVQTQRLTSIRGIIMPRELVVTLRKSDDIDKTYDGTDAVLEKDAQGNTTAATKPYEAELYDATNGTGGNIVFDDHVAQNISVDSTGYIDSQHKQALQLQFNPADPTYRDASGTANANASTTKNDRYIDYTGLKLASTSSNPNLINNYYLGDGNGNVLFYAGNDLTATDGNGNSQTFIKQTNASDGGTLTATGTIERRFIDATGITVTGAPTSKTYDGDWRVKDNGSDSLSVVAAVNAGTANILAADAGKMTFTAVSGDFLNGGGTVEANATDYNGQGTGAQKVSYNVQVSATDPDVLNNYTFVNKATLQNQTGDATADLTALDARTTYLGRDLQGGLVQTGSGIGIDKRVVDVSLDTAVAKNIDKPYDSWNKVTSANYADYVSYKEQGKSTLDSVLEADLTNGSVTKAVYAEYTDPNVQRDANRNVLQEQNQVAYTVGLKGSGAGNYQVRDVAAGGPAVDANALNGNGVGVALDAKGTGTITPITLSVGSVSKVYDATDSVANAAIDIGGVLAQDANDVQAAAGTGSHFDNKNAGLNKTVVLNDMSLSGSKSDNYDLAQSATVNTGTITPRTISKSAVVLLDANGNVIATPSKVYDGTTTYDIANKTLLSSSILPGDTVSFQLVDAKFNNENATNFVPPSLNGIGGLLPGAHNVYYEVTASGSDIENYSFVNNATWGDRLNATTHYGAANDGFYTAGTITPRTVYLAIDDMRAITKPYDGDATVKEQANGAYLQFNPTTAGGSGGYVLYDSTVGAGHEFVPADLTPGNNGQSPVSLNIRANYDTKNVSRDSAGNVQSDKVVTYDISLAGDYKGNYILANQSTGAAVNYNYGGSGSVSYTQNHGEITPLTVNTTFSGVNRVYDGEDKVYSSSVDNISQVAWDHVLAADKGKIALNPNLALQGAYQSTGGEGAKDVYVNNGQVDDKNITITSGISTAFVDNSGDYTVGNYDFVDSGTGTGKITPRPVGILELRDSNGNVVSHADSKPYDGNASYLGSLSGSYSVQAQNTGVAKGTSGDGIIQGDNFDFGFGSRPAYYANAQGQEDGNATGYNGTGTGAERVFYDVTVTALNGTNAANYTFGQAGSTDYLVNGGNYGSAASVAGTIDRRTITIEQVANSGVTKEYDGTASINGAALENNGNASATDFGNVVNYAGDSANDPTKQLVTSSGAPLDVAWDFSKSAYDTENVKRDAQNNNAVLPDNHRVSYVVSLTGAAAGNYVLQDVNGTSVATGANTNTSPSTLTYGATGTITPRQVDVIGSGANGAFTKVYDGTTNVSSTQLQTGTKIVRNSDHSVNGLVQRNGVTDNVQVSGNLSYTDENVGQNITINGQNSLALTGSDSGNYKLVGTYLPTGGEITQRTLYVQFKNTVTGVGGVTGIDREYNGANDTSVDSRYWNIVELDPTVVQPGDSSGVGVVSGDDVKLKQDGNGDYTYRHEYSDGNVARNNSGNVDTKTVYYYGFELDGTAMNNYVIHTAGNTKYNGYESLEGSGTINPKKIEVSIDSVSKVYDGMASVESEDLTAIEKSIQETLDTTRMVANDSTIQAWLEKGTYKDNNNNDTIHANANLGVDYTLAWDNANYELVAVPTNSSGSILSFQHTVPTDHTDGRVHVTFTTIDNNNVIKPKVISKIQVQAASKDYDGTTTVNDAAKNLDFADKIGNDDLQITATGYYDDPNAALDESATVPMAHTVNYAYTIGNTDYRLDSNGAMTGTTSGSGIINRAKLTVQPDNVTVANAAEARSHSYTGTVTGFQNGENYPAGGSFSYELDPTGTAVYGWYTNERGNNRVGAGSTGADLNYGRNYTLQFNSGTMTYSTPSPNPTPNPNPNPSPNPNPGGNTPTPQNVNPTPGGPGGGSGWGGIVPNPSPNPTPTPGGENGGTGENPGTGGNAGPGGSGTGLDGSSSNGGVSWDALMALGGTGTGGTANGAAASTIATTSAVLAEAGSKKVTPDNTILVQVSESDGLAEAANVAETPFSSASVAYKSTGVNAADLSSTGQIVGVSSNADVDSEIALESSAGSVSISNDSNTESDAELEHSDATVNITTQGGTRSSISLGTSGDGVNLSTGTRSDATTKTEASSSEQTETSSGISIRVQKDDKEEDTETGEENRSKTQDSSLIGLETLKDAVNLGAPMNTAV